MMDVRERMINVWLVRMCAVMLVTSDVTRIQILGS